MATPQQYGAVGDGITDDSAAFQAAMNAVYNSGGAGGGVVFVPAGNYAFSNNITIPTGVTLHGDWKDWLKSGGGLVGTTFKVYQGAGLTNGTPFITMSGSTALRDVNIWYPNQNAASIVGYPFSIGLDSDCVVQNVGLVNSYQGIETFNGGSKHILRTVIGSPLYKGIDLDQIFDVCHAEDIRFSPDVWVNSGVSNAPVSGGPHATWMRANGTAMRLLRVDGEMCMDTFISGYRHQWKSRRSLLFRRGQQLRHGIAGAKYARRVRADVREFHSRWRHRRQPHQHGGQRQRDVRSLPDHWAQWSGGHLNRKQLAFLDAISKLHDFQRASAYRAGRVQRGEFDVARQHAMRAGRERDAGGFHGLHFQSDHQSGEQRQCQQSAGERATGHFERDTDDLLDQCGQQFSIATGREN